ncbi:hypothetical protein [Aureimonas psammosilenae]|uniref:hypothetical protein n=1 Tax=Aureimonas psammosilenae TaxID=2495496 RepID=UPI001260528E|nr:hypothetical protein [Aureimonas psammosilenae]
MPKGSIVDRLAAVEQQLAGRRSIMSKQERDAMVAASLADPTSRKRALAALVPNDDRGRAVIEASFRAAL